MSTEVQGYTFRIVDLARDDLVIRGKTFEDCNIYGPAVLAPLGGAGIIEDCAFAASNPAEVFLSADVGKITGVIGLEKCVLRRCRLIKIAFAGTPDLLKKLQANVAKR